MKNFWISWCSKREYGEFESKNPWWITGIASGGSSSNIAMAMKAISADEAKVAISESYKRTVNVNQIRWKFCEEKPANWSPFNDKFPKGPWMSW